MENAFNGIVEAAESNVTGGYVKDGLVYCPNCNTPSQTRITNPFTGNEAIVGCLCKCRAERMEREERASKEADRWARAKRARLASFEESDYAGMTFGKDDGQTPKLRRQMENYVNHFPTFLDNGQGLVLFGGVGAGKTFYSACIANRLIDEGFDVFMTNFPSLVAKMQRDTFGSTDYLKLLTRYDLLIVDDLGVERSTEYMQEQVYSIIDARYRARKPIIVSTNLTAQELRQPDNVMAARIYGRILERCLPIRFEGKDRRKQNTCYQEMQAILNS